MLSIRHSLPSTLLLTALALVPAHAQPARLCASPDAVQNWGLTSATQYRFASADLQAWGAATASNPGIKLDTLLTLRYAGYKIPIQFEASCNWTHGRVVSRYRPKGGAGISTFADSSWFKLRDALATDVVNTGDVSVGSDPYWMQWIDSTVATAPANDGLAPQTGGSVLIKGAFWESNGTGTAFNAWYGTLLFRKDAADGTSTYSNLSQMMRSDSAKLAFDMKRAVSTITADSVWVHLVKLAWEPGAEPMVVAVTPEVARPGLLGGATLRVSATGLDVVERGAWKLEVRDAAGRLLVARKGTGAQSLALQLPRGAVVARLTGASGESRLNWVVE
jgi:hypothetical protein